jgi:hypothetical protein
VQELLANPHTPRWLLRKVLEHGVVALLVGRRGSFKSYIALHWLMQVAITGLPIVLLSAEGAALSNRIAAWLQHHAPAADPATLRILAIECRVNLMELSDLAAIHTAVEKWGHKPVAFLIDTLSKNSGRLDEDSNSEVKVLISHLDVHLRQKFDCTVLLVHHAGHNNLGRARGASALEADTDACYVVTREGPSKTVAVSRERFKDSEELPPLGYEAVVVDLGRVDEDGQPITSLALVGSDAPTQVKPKAAGKNQEKALAALREWAGQNSAADIVTSEDLTGLLTRQGLTRMRRREVTQYLVDVRVLTPSIAGHKLHREML